MHAPHANVVSYGSYSGGIVGTLEDMKTKAEDQLLILRPVMMVTHVHMTITVKRADNAAWVR